MSRKKEDVVRDWLAGVGTREDVEKDVQEAVFVLSPKRAPHPRKNIDHVFSTLRGGPLSLLPEEDIHDDVEMIFSGVQNTDVLPKGNITNVLDALQEGPLSKEGEESTVDERTEEEDNIIPLRRSWSVWGTVVAVAAVLLLLVQPALQNPVMMTSYQEPQISMDTKSVQNQTYDDEVFEEVLEDEIVEKSSFDSSKRDVQPTKPMKKEKSKSSLPSPAKRTTKRQSEVKSAENLVSDQKRARTDATLYTTSSSEATPMDDVEDFEQPVAMERVAPAQEEEMEIVQKDVLEEEPAAPVQDVGVTASSTRAKTRKNEDVDVLSILRAEALQGKTIPRHTPFANLNKEVLISITQDADVQKMFWASYELAIRFPQERDYIESLLRLKTSPSMAQKYLVVLLGDLYRNEGNLEAAKKAYRQALQIK